ncbi:unnamed protein product [Lampetra planeri]
MLAVTAVNSGTPRPIRGESIRRTGRREEAGTDGQTARVEHHPSPSSPSFFILPAAAAQMDRTARLPVRWSGDVSLNDNGGGRRPQPQRQQQQQQRRTGAPTQRAWPGDDDGGGGGGGEAGDVGGPGGTGERWGGPAVGRALGGSPASQSPSPTSEKLSASLSMASASASSTPWRDTSRHRVPASFEQSSTADPGAAAIGEFLT